MISPEKIAGRIPTEMCGGCGNSDPAQRCIGCLHEFAPAAPASERDSLTALERLRLHVHDHETFPFSPEDAEEILEEYEVALSELLTLRAERDEARGHATDNRYMLEAYWTMLGPTGLKVAAMWKEKGVSRVHQSWGPMAHLLSGEERAQAILDTEEAMKTARLVERIDGTLSTEDSHG